VSHSYAARTFAVHLRQFARSVDTVDKATFDGVRELVIHYSRREVGEGAYFELLREQPSQAGPVLHTFWSSEEKWQVLPVAEEDGSYGSVIAASFGRECPVWVVTTDEMPLDAEPPSEYEDQWSITKDLPRHRSASRREVRTLIVVPLRRKRPLGAFIIESQERLEATDMACSELTLLGEALATLLELWELNETRSRSTSEAVADLRDMLVSAQFPRLAKPQVFVAHAVRADEQVIDVLRTVLREYESRLDITFWNQIEEAGNITSQVGERIAQSRFGICYLSEPAGEAQRYVDNPNVVFEAGMLHALTNAVDAPPTGWIPIREKGSPPAPFDFAAERILEVARNVEGHVAARFANDLRRRLNALLGPAH
jgi:hypothetical protein